VAGLEVERTCKNEMVRGEDRSMSVSQAPYLLGLGHQCRGKSVFSGSRYGLPDLSSSKRCH
jgi:hypothetical protein